jgi:hypothetical protein
MLSNTEIVKQLRTTADESTAYQNKWLSADNWIELMKAHNTNPTLTSNVLNTAVMKDPSTKNVVDLKNGASNQTGIYRNQKQVKGRRVCYYYYYSTVPGSDVDEFLWGNGPFIAIRNEREDTPDDKTLFEAASRIIKLEERENLTLDKAVGCVACSKPARKRQTTQEGFRK